MRSLQQRLSMGLALALGVLLALGGLLAYPALRSLLIEEFDYALLAKVRALTTPPTTGGKGVSLRFTEYPPPEFQPGPRAEFFQVWSRDNAVIAKSPSLGSVELLRPAQDTNAMTLWNLTLPDGRPGRAASLRLSFDEGAEAPEFTVVLARDTLRLRGVLRAVAAGLIGGGALLLVAATWVTRVTTRAGLRPLAVLADQVTRIDVASLQTRLRPEEAPPELRSIVEQLNSLLDRLHAAFDRERRFSANVAHELLTPVAELRAMAENAVRWREEQEATAHFATDTLESAQQMERLVTTLLALARSERGELQFHQEPVRLSRLLEDLRVPLASRLQAKHLTLEWIIADDAVISSDHAACRAIFQNLLDNAVEYTPVHGRIVCRLESRVESGGGFIFTVANTNPGLQPETLLHLFQPFWRADVARSDRSHAGLGLALAKALAEALHFDLAVSLPRPDEVRFTLVMRVSFP